jgi:hypothetical protein
MSKTLVLWGTPPHGGPSIKVASSDRQNDDLVREMLTRSAQGWTELTIRPDRSGSDPTPAPTVGTHKYEVGQVVELGLSPNSHRYRVTEILKNANESVTGKPLHQVNLTNVDTGEPSFTYATGDEVTSWGEFVNVVEDLKP